MKKYFKIALTVILFATSSAYAQVGMMSNNPDKSAVLDMKAASNKGVLIPNVSLNSTTDVSGIAGGAPAQSLLVFNTNASITGTNAAGTGYYYWDTNSWKKLINKGDLSGVGDNLGNHTATTTLNMANNNIDNIKTAYINNEAQIRDRNTSNTNYFGLYKNNGTLGVWNNSRGTNEISIDETTGKSTLTSAAIAKGTDGAAPVAGYLATAADASGNVVWSPATSITGNISQVVEGIGSTQVNLTSGSTGTIVPATTVTLTKKSTVLITYSACPLPLKENAPVQGSIDLIVDGSKVISSYYSAADAPTMLVQLGNYSTTQKVIRGLAAGNHTFTLQAKSWYNSTMFNVNPFPGYGGSTSGDAQAMTSRMTIIVFNE